MLACLRPQRSAVTHSIDLPVSCLLDLKRVAAFNVAYTEGTYQPGRDYWFCCADVARVPDDQATQHFLRGRMHGEGDTMRHLASMGFRLRYEQDPRAEFDFAVANLRRRPAQRRAPAAPGRAADG